MSASPVAVSSARPRASRATPARKIKSRAIGHSVTTRRSAPLAGSTICAARMSIASGRSMRRDQCITTPSGGLSRYWVRSNQPWPARKSRTSTSRIASSVDSESSRHQPAIRSAAAMAHQMMIRSTRVSAAGDDFTAPKLAAVMDIATPARTRAKHTVRALRAHEIMANSE